MADNRRILCVTSNFPRWTGDSTTPFVLHLAQDLRALGWSVDVLAPHAPGTVLREIMEGVQIERFRYLWPDSQETVCYRGGALINLRKNPINYLKLPALVLAEWAAVRRRLASGDYDLVHSHWILPQGFVGSLSAPGWGIPHVITVHGGDVFSLRGALLAGSKRYAMRRADMITVNSSVTEQAVRALGVGSTPIERIPMGVGVDVPRRENPEVLRLVGKHRRKEGPLLLFVGRLVEEKGVADLLRAVAVLGKRFPGSSAVIVGEGQDRLDLERLSESLGLNDRVVFTGWVATPRVSSFMVAADCLIAPSRQAATGWVEAQGLSILEAMACNTPVIATRLGGVVDSVIHEQTGLLVDERAPDQIAGAVERLLLDPVLTEGLRLRARERVLRRFSRQASAEAFSQVYSRLLDLNRS